MHFEMLALLIFLTIASTLFAQSSQPAAIDVPKLGTLIPRSAKEIKNSMWSIGCETLDRDFVDYSQSRKYLGPLGAKHARFQAGWAKCEKKPGEYDFRWLDAVIDDALTQGVQPWLQTSYGNPIYEGGGSIHIGGGIPTSPDALVAWDRWVRALVRHFKSRVQAWEVWNEPDLRNANPPERYADLFIRTATIIREEQPDAQIYALSLAGNSKFCETFLRMIKEQNKISLIDAITVHGYPSNPDELSSVDKVEKILASLDLKIPIRQGETGAPSTALTAGALSGHPWSETLQAKYNLRRMLAHHARGIPFNLFTLTDMAYFDGKNSRLNSKGLVEATMELKVIRPKLAYQAAQSVFTLFDDSLTPLPDFPATVTGDIQPVLHAYNHKSAGPFVVLWIGGSFPSESNDYRKVDLSLPEAKWSDPVYVDLLTGTVHQIPKDRWTGGTLKQIPVYDSPIVIAERAAIATR